MLSPFNHHRYIHADLDPCSALLVLSWSSIYLSKRKLIPLVEPDNNGGQAATFDLYVRSVDILSEPLSSHPRLKPSACSRQTCLGPHALADMSHQPQPSCCTSSVPRSVQSLFSAKKRDTTQSAKFPTLNLMTITHVPVGNPVKFQVSLNQMAPDKLCGRRLLRKSTQHLYLATLLAYHILDTTSAVADSSIAQRVLIPDILSSAAKNRTSEVPPPGFTFAVQLEREDANTLARSHPMSQPP